MRKGYIWNKGKRGNMIRGSRERRKKKDKGGKKENRSREKRGGEGKTRKQ